MISGVAAVRGNYRGELSLPMEDERKQGEMRQKAPKVPTNVWKDLYLAAEKFNILQPWNVLDDIDLVCARDPRSRETGCGVVMGSGGSVFGFCLYRGDEGFDVYRRTIEGEVEPEADDLFAMQNCLLLEFGPRKDMTPEDLAILKELGLTFRGKNAWPQFRSMLPGYAPWFLTEDEALFLTLGINAACLHFERLIRREVVESFRENECLVYTAAEEAPGEFTSGWEPLPVYERKRPLPPILNLAAIDAIKRKKLKPDTGWEADVFFMPMPIMDRERPYYVRTAVVCQRQSGFVFDMETAPPETAQHQLLADVVCSAVGKSGLKPESISVRKGEYVDALAPLGNVLGIALRSRGRLDAVEEMKNEMLDFMMNQGGGGRR